jgi:signal transduction histidine kinase
LANLARGNDDQERLLRALAEQLKLPLMQIARQAELADVTGVKSYKSISYTADMALRLIDSYLLSVELQALPSLQLEPVSVSAMLQDTAHSLSELAKQYNCDLQINLKGKYQPVMAHHKSLEAALTSLGYAFIESAAPSEERRTVVLGAHQSSRGLVVGVFGDQPEISADALKRGIALFGTAKQAIPSFSASAGAGVFVANALLANLEAPLHTSRHNKLSGLAATLLPSHQLSII